MSVYQRFEKHDLLEAYVHVRPKLEFASGTVGVSGSSNGWRGNVGVSSSISLYDGIRARTDVKSSDFAQSGITVYPLDPVDTHSIDKVIFVSGSYPSTGSVTFVKARNSASLNKSQVTSQDWWKEHFAPIELLYDYYNRYDHDFTTGSYDYYMLRFRPLDPAAVARVTYSQARVTEIGTELTCEAYVKPLSVRGTSSFTIQRAGTVNENWAFQITGSTGELCFKNWQGQSLVSTGYSVPTGSWSRVAVSISGGLASFYIGSDRVCTGVFTGSLVTFDPVLTVGGGAPGSASLRNGFDGFMFESRIWKKGRTLSQMSATYNRTMTDYANDQDLIHYSRFNDGPLATEHGNAAGSGVFDYANVAGHGVLGGFQQSIFFTNGPIWTPNDNPNFVTTKNLRADRGVQMVRVLHVPSMFYGKQIATGSVRLQCNAYSNVGIRRVLVDDGFGGLYLSGSVTRQLSGESYTGPKWNKVGNVFYSEGLVVIRDPALLDFGDKFASDVQPGEDLLQVSFAGSDRISTKVLMCRANQAELNYSNNPTSYDWDTKGTVDPTDDVAVPVREDGTTFITAIGIYDDERRLVAVAKLAQPIRKRTKDKIMIRLRLDI